MFDVRKNEKIKQINLLKMGGDGRELFGGMGFA